MLGLGFEERLPCLFSDADEHNWYTPKCERYGLAVSIHMYVPP
jgi:hypothetical protein